MSFHHSLISFFFPFRIFLFCVRRRDKLMCSLMSVINRHSQFAKLFHFCSVCDYLLWNSPPNSNAALAQKRKSGLFVVIFLLFIFLFFFHFYRLSIYLSLSLPTSVINTSFHFNFVIIDSEIVAQTLSCWTILCGMFDRVQLSPGEHAISCQGRVVQTASWPLCQPCGLLLLFTRFTPGDTAKTRRVYPHISAFLSESGPRISIRSLDQSSDGGEEEAAGAITFPDYLYLIHNAS